MEVRDPPCRTSNEPQTGGLAGLDLQHELHVVLSDWTGWTPVTALLQGLGAEVQSLQLARVESGFSARCRLRHISVDDARTIPGTLIDSGVARHASVEHLMLSKQAAGIAP